MKNALDIMMTNVLDLPNRSGIEGAPSPARFEISEQKEKERFVSHWTYFGRYAAAFDHLVDNIIPEQFTRSEPLRIWIPGCSTGEMVWDMAFRLAYRSIRTHTSLDFSIIGTDCSPDVITMANADYAFSNPDRRPDLGLNRKQYDELKKQDYIFSMSEILGPGYDLSKRVEFTTHNICAASPPLLDSRPFDIIAYMNVSMYLTNQGEKMAWENIIDKKTLSEDGLVLFAPRSSIPIQLVAKTSRNIHRRKPLTTDTNSTEGSGYILERADEETINFQKEIFNARVYSREQEEECEKRGIIYFSPMINIERCD